MNIARIIDLLDEASIPMTEEITIDMKWATAVPMLIEIIQHGTPQGRADARDELLRCARIADDAVGQQRELFELRAQAEGWAIFYADGSDQNRLGNCPIQIQFIHDLGLLEDDAEAHKLVVKGAKENKPHCLHALRRLRREAKPELAVVYHNELERTLDGEDCVNITDAQLDALETVIFGKAITSPVNAPASSPELAGV